MSSIVARIETDGFRLTLHAEKGSSLEPAAHYNHHLKLRGAEIKVLHEKERGGYYVLHFDHKGAQGSVYLSPEQLRDLVDEGSRVLAENGDYELLEFIPGDNAGQPRIVR